MHQTVWLHGKSLQVETKRIPPWVGLQESVQRPPTKTREKEG